MSSEAARLYLQSRLEQAFPGVPVYYRPPGDFILPRPCIVYSREQTRPVYAANNAYILGEQYQVTALSGLPGMDVSPMFTMAYDISILANRSFVHQDVVNDVFTVTVKSI